jgi:predicted unusual protein kinase regulating ubiquinone biosynthesis (AarF/ABC1/UbiB family)
VPRSPQDRPARRALELGTLSATVAASYVGGALRRLFLPADEREGHRAAVHRKNAERILAVGGRLKGGIMKAMQLLSYQHEVLPDEYLDILADLQDQAPAMAPEEARAVIEAELGAPPDRLFATFEAEPAAAASLGQVHRATLDDGRPVAVKVQYPGIAESVAADLKLLRRMLAAQKIAGKDVLRQAGLDHRHLHDDVAARLAEEVDYRREALHARVFREMYRGFEGIRVPAVVEERSTARVLTTDWIDGYPIRDVMNEGADYALRERVVLALNRMSMHEVLGVGIVHADPHPGNYLVTADGDVALLDFGCVKVIDDVRRGHFRDEVRALLDGDREGLVRSLQGLGLVQPGEDPAPHVAFAEFMYLPLLQDVAFDARAMDFPAELAKRFADLVKARSFAFPPHMIFLLRKFIGLSGVFRALRVHTVNYRRAYLDYLARDAARADALRRRLFRELPDLAAAAT